MWAPIDDDLPITVMSRAPLLKYDDVRRTLIANPLHYAVPLSLFMKPLRPSDGESPAKTPFLAYIVANLNRDRRVNFAVLPDMIKKLEALGRQDVVVYGTRKALRRCIPKSPADRPNTTYTDGVSSGVINGVNVRVEEYVERASLQLQLKDNQIIACSIHPEEDII
jgi:hypothetical protein